MPTIAEGASFPAWSLADFPFCRFFSSVHLQQIGHGLLEFQGPEAQRFFIVRHKRPTITLFLFPPAFPGLCCHSCATHREQYAIAASEFAEKLKQLKALYARFDALQQRVEHSGAPWTPGRFPDWQPEY